VNRSSKLSREKISRTDWTFRYAGDWVMFLAFVVKERWFYG